MQDIVGDPETDLELMQRAIALGASVRRRTAPNPWVGAVVVRDGVVVGEGATQPPGGPHAEAVALAGAADRARGATVYVSLEPCSHRGRTGPCADALLAAGVARVVVAIEDPDAQVAGTGIARLRAAGVRVDVGPAEVEAAAALAAYLHHRRTGRAWAVLKTATSLDGRIAAADGSSRWITGPEARADAHGLRADSQAVLVGAATAIADRPALTVRDAAEPPLHPPLRVVLDSRGRVPADGPLFDGSAPTLVVTSETVAPAAADAWRAAGAKVETVVPSPSMVGLDPRAVLELLGRNDVLQVLVEGGSLVHGAFLDAGMADRLVVYVGATALGPRGRPVLDGPGPDSIEDAPRFDLLGVGRLGPDVRLDYAPRRP